MLSSRTQPALGALLAILAAFALGNPSPGGAATCTAVEKAKHVRALKAYKRQLAAQRRAYFRTHRSPATRRAFVRQQQRRLRLLERAARCRVTPPRADLAVSIAAAGTSELTLTIVVRNRGPAPAADTTVVHSPAAGVEVVSATPTAGTCSTSATAIICDIGSVTSGAAVTVTIVARRYRTGAIESSASAESPTRDPDGANNSATVQSDWPLPAASTGPPCSPMLTIGTGANFHEGPTNYSNFVRPVGQVRAVALFLDFPDAPQTETTQDLYDSLAPRVIQWYGEASYGRFSLSIDPLHLWLRMPKPSAAYNLSGRGSGLAASFSAYLADAVSLADSSVDFRQYSLVVLVPPDRTAVQTNYGFFTPPGAGALADGVEIRRGAIVASPERRQPEILVHELGHVFGLPDIYDLTVPYQDGTSYVGGWDPMSRASSPSHFLVWHKWKLGWLDPSQLRCLTLTGQLEETIAPIETPGGVKGVIVPTGASTAHVIDAHRLVARNGAACDSGVLVYTVDATVPPGQAPPIRVKPAQPDADPLQVDRCGPLYRAAFDLGPGEVSTYEDAVLKVEVLATDGISYHVRVTRK